MEQKMLDHLFRHHYGKMVSVLIRIFGLRHLETIEDAIQDTFIKAMSAWRVQKPDNPEAWLTAAAKNRVLDIFRKLKAEKQRIPNVTTGTQAIAINDLFLDTEIEDSVLRMIFTACHPKLSATDRIAFALKTISGFTTKEIASAVLTKEDTIKKRLSRARKVISRENITFEIPLGEELVERLDSVHEVLYLIFNEGFHSNRTDILVRKELCGEAMRLCKMVLKNKKTRNDDGYALFALMCFHAARLDSKMNDKGEIIDLPNQDRSLWYFPLIRLGNEAMNQAVINNCFSHYHYEASIAAEHLKAPSFETTNWRSILKWYRQMYQLRPDPMTALNMALVHLQLGELQAAEALFRKIEPASLEQRSYLYYGTMAEYYLMRNEIKQALSCLELALGTVKNESEKQYLFQKKEKIKQQLNDGGKARSEGS
ncbi:sigma factor, ECF subfamily protein [Pukyongia salina]|uniref:Sigma factor, ECF subfamily protein n=1 Tax=Pukyongia salina TaxID=2094025 RepID=A0A2S0I032_9FLAO|nr:sigma-70 family RNA polymerase sigma factor [Pukyongia salina]AVI52226.1 sigma factor, ECF subfamily protein [Pukyongia salina]